MLFRSLSPDSAAFAELTRTRENFVERSSATERDRREADIQALRADGKISDVDYLAYLRDAYDGSTPGTADWVRAGTRLREYTFSLAEDKLRFDVTKGTRPVSDLIRFYESYQRTMDPAGERWRALQLTIDALKRGGRAGGGGGGGGGAGSAFALGPKLIDGTAALVDLLGGGKPPPGFADLFRIDPTAGAAYQWWKNNLRSATLAFSDRRTTWTYYDPSGNAYVLPFSPEMIGDFDSLDLAYMRIGLASAENVDDAQTWVSRIISAGEHLQSHGARLTMDVFDEVWDDLERQKQRALAGGRFADYANLAAAQRDWATRILESPYITYDDRQKVATRVFAASPRVLDPGKPGHNPGGDPVLGAIADGTIVVRVDPSTGRVLLAVLEDDKGYVTQIEDGSFALVLLGSDDYRLDPENERPVPKYQDDHVRVTLSHGEEDVSVWQPFSEDGQVPVYRTGDPVRNLLRLPAADYPTVVRSPADGLAAQINVLSLWTRENGAMVQWLSLDGQTWVRAGDRVPRIVVPSNVAFTADGKWQIDGQDAAPAQVAALARWWSLGDTRAEGSFGVPGMTPIVRTVGRDGTIDMRAPWVLNEERAARRRALVEAPWKLAETRPEPTPFTDPALEERREARRLGVAPPKWVDEPDVRDDWYRAALAPLSVRRTLAEAEARRIGAGRGGPRRPLFRAPRLAPIELDQSEIALPPPRPLAPPSPAPLALQRATEIPMPELAPLPGSPPPQLGLPVPSRETSAVQTTKKTGTRYAL